MGFLDKLKDIGLGSRGPYGRIESGAQRLSGQMDRSTSNMRNRGLTQAIAAAAKDGAVSFQTQVELSEKWGIPLREVMLRVKPANSEHEKTRLANMGKTFYGLTKTWKKENPGKKITTEIAQDLAGKSGATTGQDAAMLLGGLQKIQGQKKLVVGDNQRVFNLGSLSGDPVTKVIDSVPQGGTGKQKDAKSYILPNKEPVLSYDGGRTYIDKNGKRQPMSSQPGAYPTTIRHSGEEIAALQSRESAVDEIPLNEADKKVLSDSAKIGTGPYAKIKSGMNALFGGLGLDKLLGQKGFFVDETDARQQLDLFRQRVKTALMNNSKGAIYEQEKIDKLVPNTKTWLTNPETEARKLVALRRQLVIERNFNTKSIAGSITSKEIVRLRRKNYEIDRVLEEIGFGSTDSNPDLSPQAQEWLKKKGY